MPQPLYLGIGGEGMTHVATSDAALGVGGKDMIHATASAKMTPFVELSNLLYSFLIYIY